MCGGSRVPKITAPLYKKCLTILCKPTILSSQGEACKLHLVNKRPRKEETFTTFGEKLKKLRVRQQLTQGQVAEYIGISRRAYISYEQNNVRPRKDETFQKLSEILKCDVNYLRDEQNFVSAVEKGFAETMATVLVNAFAPLPVRVAAQAMNVYTQKAPPTSHNEPEIQMNKLLALQEERLNQFRATALGIIATAAAEKGISFQQMPVQRLETTGDKPEACAKLFEHNLSEWWFLFWTKVPQLEENAFMTARDRASMLMGRLVTMEPDPKRKTSIVVDDRELAGELKKMYGSNSYRGNLTVVLIDRKDVRISNEDVISLYKLDCNDVLMFD